MEYSASLILTAVLAAQPQHLVVLQHGLYGTKANMMVLQQKLHAYGGGRVCAHLAESNEGRTRDGVAAGGRRLADEIRDVVRKKPTLQTISLVGNSLGGLYVRAAAAYILDDKRLQLEPRVLVTTGCPHLGVRRYTYLPLPRFLSPAATLVAGRTGDELLLRDRPQDNSAVPPLLVEMSEPDGCYGQALSAFSHRRLYANLVGDFMVPFGTAAIEAGDWGSGVNDATLASAFWGRSEGVRFRNEAVCRGTASGVAVVIDQRAKEDIVTVPMRADGADVYEERMRLGLSSVSWSKVGVAFVGATTLLPMAHNRLPALRREGWRRALEYVEQANQGVDVMEHAAQYILQGLTGSISTPGA